MCTLIFGIYELKVSRGGLNQYGNNKMNINNERTDYWRTHTHTHTHTL